MTQGRTSYSDTNFLYLTLRYVGVLLLIALLSGVFFWISYSVTLEQQKDGKVISVSGQQRTLALQVEMLGGRLLYVTDGDIRRSLQDQLSETLDQLERTHLKLAYGDMGDGLVLPMSAEVQSLFFDTKTNLDAKVRKFLEYGFSLSVSDGGNFPSDNAYFVAISSMRPEINAGLDIVVAAYQRETDEKISRLKAIQEAGFFAMLAVLLSSGLLVFRPMAHKIKSNFRALRKAHDQLGIQNVQLEMAKDKFEKQATELVAMTEDLLCAKNEAERAQKAMGGFMASMSHELRTPLNAILGFSQLMEYDKSSPLTPSQENGIGIIKKSGEHLLDLINELLDLSKIEAGTFQVDFESVDPKPVVEECHNLTVMQASKSGIEMIDLTVDKTLPLVRADGGRVRQALLNFMSNAIKYNSENGTVRTDCQVEGGYLVFSVADTGKGLSPKQLETLFQAYARLGAEQTTIEGTGLGLTITKKLVELMEGEIGVDSVVGQGSVFWFKLPLHE